MRPVGEERRRAIAEEVNRLLAAGFIIEIKHPKWLGNPVLVLKKNKIWRMCIDYTSLNSACPKDPFVLPQIDQIINAVTGSESLCFLDAYSGYNQIKMAKEDQEKTAFITPLGAYCYTSMTFGLKNAGATYQRCMNSCLESQIGRNIHVYIDDVVVKSTHQADLITDLAETFANLRRYKIKLNPLKCTFGVPSGQLLGYVVSKRGIEPNPEKTLAVMRTKQPKCLVDAQKLAGRVAALSRFIPRLGDKAMPLYRLLKKSESFRSTDEAQRALEELQHALRNAPILAAPLPKETMLLYVAASNRAISAVMVVERKEEGKEQLVQRPVYYISEALIESKQRYPHYQKLMMVILFSEDASNIVSHPNKSKKASVPMLSVRIGDHCYYGLCDIGASISAIPYELYTEIMHEIGSCELEDIDVVIQLANRETISPIGIVRDVEVLCDCKKEKILTKFAGESYEFNFSKFTKTPYKIDPPNNDFKFEQCASISLAPNNPLQQHLENSESEVFRKERDELEEIFLRQPILKHDLPVEDLGTTPPPKEDPVFDLKPLPDNLKYAHIDDKKIYPIIISSKLTEFEEERLLEILKKHRGAIGYTLDDLKGISPSICQHAINMEDDAKPVVEPQRRLIPKMKDVVRNEVLRLLEAGIIYPIADSRWVSPVHCVPRKGGMTVVPNDNDELIPQRVVVGYRMCIDYRKVNKRCEETNLVLNWEKCHFMVNEGIVLGHKISERGIEVDRAKVEAIEKMPYPRDVKGIRSVLGHAGFSKPLTNLLQKDVPFVFDDDCKEAFETLKKALTTAPIVEPPDWNLPFEIMCDASDFSLFLDSE
ncbi:hypothetical protein QYE76_008922 [Lolium multiflorum]|uniref:Reverse transcriptase domain-containing protein n=1 Tax=Lolium multiflorum TaxID=4521 RepID=A0AAD8X1E7_LOLMU|nr:hypothetical protein QYE76_008922 [Lolium multiflorum]